MVIFPLAPDQTIAQMWSNGARGCNMHADIIIQENNLTQTKKSKHTVSEVDWLGFHSILSIQIADISFTYVTRYTHGINPY